MTLVARYRLTLAIVLVAVAATGGFLLFGLPRAQTPNDNQRTVDMARVHHYSVAFVRKTFEAHGLELPYSWTFFRVETLSSVQRPVPDTALQVDVILPHGDASWGPKPAGEYDQPVGNLVVHYGGKSAAILARVKAAVAALTG